ncbi:hypothetical protein Dda_4251 [Drechslerella dactyloides]|uniref:Uncharacterized protein n=1 Tax=Drechslerella dactyloides TaxID=74499 RepID=A0AAD6NJ93_DREDA|nr:hypothetical protein Dda_4251 [Drechslerella dactyloides]
MVSVIKETLFATSTLRLIPSSFCCSQLVEFWPYRCDPDPGEALILGTMKTQSGEQNSIQDD